MIVASFWAPRPDHPYYHDYTPYLDVLRASCERFGHRHIVITDDETIPDAFVAAMPENLMKAIIRGQLAYLRSGLAEEDTVFVGADCALARDPAEVFKEYEFDIAFTTGHFADCILNTGAIFIRGGADARPIWAQAFAAMGPEWGDDQKALAAVVEPIEVSKGVTATHKKVHGLSVLFLPVDPYNLAPSHPESDCTHAYVLHFRGPRKAWMADYCARWLGIGKRLPIVVSNTVKEKVFDNIRLNSRRDLPWVKEVRAHNRQAVLIGGGPSLKDDLEEIRLRDRASQDLFALNGAAAWLARQGVTPEYQVLLDARTQNRRFAAPPSARQFFIASQCDPVIFSLLAGEDVTLFHHLEDGLDEAIGAKAFQIGGGTTVGLTAMALVYVLGYRNLHLYGYDSSDRDGESHAYPQFQNGQENGRLEVLVGQQKFSSSPAMYAQAQDFPKFAQSLADLGCSITVHGSGLLPEVVRQWCGGDRIAA